MTSNIGTRDLKIDKVLGFGDSKQTDEYDKIKDSIDDAVKRIFSPEFLNRVDDFIVFRQLSKESLLKIVDIAIDKIKKRLEPQNIKLVVTDNAREFIVDKGFDKVYGARPLRRALQRYLEDPLSEELLKGNVKMFSVVEVNYNQGDDGFTFKATPEESVSAGASDPIIPDTTANNEKS